MILSYQKPLIKTLPENSFFSVAFAQSFVLLFDQAFCGGVDPGTLELVNGQVTACFGVPGPVPGDSVQVTCAEDPGSPFTIIVEAADCTNNDCDGGGPGGDDNTCTVTISIIGNAPPVCTVTSFITSGGGEEC